MESVTDYPGDFNVIALIRGRQEIQREGGEDRENGSWADVLYRCKGPLPKGMALGPRKARKWILP